MVEVGYIGLQNSFYICSSELVGVNFILFGFALFHQLNFIYAIKWKYCLNFKCNPHVWWKSPNITEFVSSKRISRRLDIIYCLSFRDLHQFHLSLSLSISYPLKSGVFYFVNRIAKGLAIRWQPFLVWLPVVQVLSLLISIYLSTYFTIIFIYACSYQFVYFLFLYSSS